MASKQVPDEALPIDVATDGDNKDPFVAGERAAQMNIPAEANPYQDGTEDFSLWSAGHERVATAQESGEGEGT